MVISILTLFPEILKPVFESSIIGRAQKAGKVRINLINIRAFSRDKHRSVDDAPYGGGTGMLLKIDVLHPAIEAARASYRGKKTKIILLDPTGPVFNQKKAFSLITLDHLILVSGHYEGFDGRIDNFVDEKLSLGRFVLTGGEIPAMAITDALVRLIPGVLKDPCAVLDESYSGNIKREAPQYTRPPRYLNFEVPKVLLSGDPKKISAWKDENSLKTRKKK